MKKFLIAVSCLALVAPSLAAAQMNPDRSGRPGQGQPDRPAKPGQGHRPGAGKPDGGANRPTPSRPGAGGPNRPGPGIPGGGAPNRPGPGIPGGGVPNRPSRPNRPTNPGHRPPHRPGYRPNPGHRPGLGWNGHRYRAGLFRYPTGYAYRRWSIGQSLPLLFLGSAYYFTSYDVLGLGPPPYGYQWVRYGPDVLLVNIRTGRIMDVEYGVFY